MKTFLANTTNMPAFPSTPIEVHEYSQYFNKLDIINIQSDKNIKKDGDYLTVDDKVIRITRLTMLDLVIRLNTLGVTCTLIGGDAVKYIPAVFLANFSSVYCNFIQPTVNPFPVHRFERLLYSSIDPQVSPELSDIVVLDGERIVEHTLINNNIYYKNSGDNSNIQIGFKMQYSNYNVVILDSMFSPCTSEGVYLFKTLNGLFT
jgi:hypothetical protein